MDPEIPAHGLGRCTDNAITPSEPPKKKMKMPQTRDRNALEK